jgi:hypothetical protein
MKESIEQKLNSTPSATNAYRDMHQEMQVHVFEDMTPGSGNNKKVWRALSRIELIAAACVASVAYDDETRLALALAEKAQREKRRRQNADGLRSWTAKQINDWPLMVWLFPWEVLRNAIPRTLGGGYAKPIEWKAVTDREHTYAEALAAIKEVRGMVRLPERRTALAIAEAQEESKAEAARTWKGMWHTLLHGTA